MYKKREKNNLYTHAHTRTHLYTYAYPYRCTAHRVRNSSFVDSSTRFLSAHWLYFVHRIGRHQYRRSRRRHHRHCYHCLRLLPTLKSAGSSHLFCIQHLYFTLWTCTLMYVMSHPRWIYTQQYRCSDVCWFVVVSLSRSNMYKYIFIYSIVSYSLVYICNT